MKTKAILLAVVAILLFNGCSRVREGVVVDKRYFPCSVGYMPVIVGKTMGVMPVSQPEHWAIVVRNSEGREREFAVCHYDYQYVSVGDSVFIRRGTVYYSPQEYDD